nr:hypothetical protein [Actinomycetota bacterium]
MSRRVPELPVGGFPQPEADVVIEGGPRRTLAWWRLRPWKKDLELLARLRDGLRALPDEPAAADAAGERPGGRHRSQLP